MYCTLGEVIADMNLRGDASGLLDRIRAASVTIEREIGTFIPVLEARSFRARNQATLVIDPILSVDKVEVDDVEITTYTLLPERPLWMHGPAVMLRLSTCWHSSVLITGSWGKYNELGAVMDSLSLAIDDTTIVMDDASLLDVGMVLLVEDEQLAITAGHGSIGCPAPSLATSKLSGAVIETEEILTVDDGTEFHKGEVLAIDHEDVLIVRISGDDLTVERGWNNTPTEGHADEAIISVYRTFAVDRGVNGTTAATHDAAAVERYLIPADINWLCRQIAGLMLMKARSGFQGRVGSAETGDAMYFSEFPPSQIRQITNHYSMKVY
ncbi:MAG: hypothetical protein AB9897_01315 [Anaerolineaceae bacterium]